ncbi:MAG TPA: MerR family transcriptional regulator [Rhodobacterales bacterium]|nr:MerR family transcriptional regulator [Rhodobacterales bacterium]
MRIGELAEKSGLSRDTIRFYERNGLIASRPGESATNNYRDYPKENLRALAFFTMARDAGMSIADLRSIVEAMGEGCAPEAGRAVIQRKIDEMTARAAQIETVVAFLTRTLDSLDGTG